ncbi:hypothetical protein GAO09_16545 [Rhizobiales bacterium RZME27]|jgi:hypothetical protein|uniref:Uncharacterized protein n=1 Tax=Endobacterium cereale TaxID=2663029 RepID=A0A6A8AEJ9_9HYPH|nr:plant virulence effector HPE1-like domain-containing protein [Endobacterium cereale]MEB2846936.1 plant virulence effector HPE1-like domain-containing protein [Endobacterium cereale]MQY47646.1 hypothetical protein [Endobacterium cereale]
MRHLVLTAAILSIGSPALASSITELATTGAKGSIVEKLCTACGAVTVAKEDDGAGIYKVPTLGADVQRTEIRDINGEEKLVRTEGWWGGSPVTFISKMPGWMTTPEQKNDATLPVRSGPLNTARIFPSSNPDGVDTDATTAAVGEQPSERAGGSEKEPGSFNQFEIRGE